MIVGRNARQSKWDTPHLTHRSRRGRDVSLVSHGSPTPRILLIRRRQQPCLHTLYHIAILVRNSHPHGRHAAIKRQHEILLAVERVTRLGSKHSYKVLILRHRRRVHHLGRHNCHPLSPTLKHISLSTLSPNSKFSTALHLRRSRIIPIDSRLTPTIRIHSHRHTARLPWRVYIYWEVIHHATNVIIGNR